MNNELLRVFEALNHAAINYCLLRGYDELEKHENRQEIDLLVEVEHLPLLTQILATKKFVRLPSWGYAPHHFFVAFDKTTDAWLKFDVVTKLLYGKPIRNLSLNITKICLHRRRWREPTYVPAPEDEFIMLLLHCLLDKASLKNNHRRRLGELYKEIDKGQAARKQLGGYIERFLEPALAKDSLDQAVHADDWQSVIDRRSVLVQQFFRRDPFLGIWRNVCERLLRRMRPLLFAIRRRGFCVTLLAPDGAGKTTLAQALIHDAQLHARSIYTGTNVDAKGIWLPTSRWLDKRVRALDTTETRQFHPRQILFKALHFINRLVEVWYRLSVATFHMLCGKIVVFDRYIYDSWLTPRSMTPWKRLRRWLLEAPWPTPDIVIFLDAPGQMLYQRKGEHTPEWLERQRFAYIGLKQRIPHMVIVDATRTANEVRCNVTSLIWNHYRTRISSGRAAASDTE